MIFIGATDEIGLDAGGKAVLGLSAEGMKMTPERGTDRNSAVNGTSQASDG